MSEDKTVQYTLMGRPEKVSPETLLKAIHDLHTKEPLALRKHFNVDRTTIFRAMKKLDSKQIDEAMGIVTEKELTPALMDKEKGFDLFKELPAIKTYHDSMLYQRKVSKDTANRRVRLLWRMCVFTRTKPSTIKPEDIQQIVERINRSEPVALAEFKRGYDLRIAARSYFMYTGISGEKLTSMGIGSEIYEKNITRSTARLSQKNRAAFMAALEKRTHTNWSSKDHRDSIKFADNPDLAKAILIVPKVLYYIGIRADSTFNKSYWEIADEHEDERRHRTKFSGVTVGLNQPLSEYQEGDEIVYRHLDKGKKGGIAWLKRLYGDFAKEFVLYWKAVGAPNKGLVFLGLKAEAVRELFKECYEEAGIPEHIWKGSLEGEAMPLHIWRHTAAQDLLDATDWNAELVAAQLGWESVDILLKHYGKVPPDVQRRLVLKAQGQKVEEKPRLFIF